MNAPQGSGDENKPAAQPSYVERRNAKALEEHRKFGLAPLAKDALTGEEISPHVPTHMATAPWYWKKQQELAGGGDGGAPLTLAHHRVEERDHTALQEVETRFLKASEVASSAASSSTGTLFASKASHAGAKKFVAGACKNCGSGSHTADACLRPKRSQGASVTKAIEGETYLIYDEVRKVGGKQASTEAQNDNPSRGGLTSSLLEGERSAAVKRDYEQKRSLAFSSNVRLSFEDAQEQHREGKRLQKALASAAAAAGSTGTAESLLGSRVDLATGAPGTLTAALSKGMAGGTSLFEAKSGADGSSALGSTGGGGDMPKYLENLDDDTIYFDPKSRSMRGDPNAMKRRHLNPADLIIGADEDIELGDDDGDDPAATSSANVFQGDNVRTHTEGYFEYIDHQYSFITGKSSKFVDMHADPKLRKASGVVGSAGGGGDIAVDGVSSSAAHKTTVVTSALYGEIGEKRPRDDAAAEEEPRF